jgi:hypothetical protein
MRRITAKPWTADRPVGVSFRVYPKDYKVSIITFLCQSLRRTSAILRFPCRQGSSGGTSSADEFLDAALTWFGDPDPRIGTAWEKGERLAKLIAHRRTLLVLDGLEPLQNPPGSQEGRLREPSRQALLREIAAFNAGLCVITTRTPVADIADHEGVSVLRLDLEQLSSDAGAKLLRALGVKGHEPELRGAS